jgi:aryl-alcohol dehydrogenase-like predicted oxidoreductase
MGTYLGECDDAEDARYVASLEAGIERGLNLLDTAINYRCQRSERAVGLALRDALAANGTSREEVIVCTKGGYVPLEGQPPESREEYSEYLETEYFKPGIMSRSDLVAGGHCLTAAFLANQIDRSRANIGVECIDIFYLHNPEQQLDTLDRAQFLLALEKAFTELESQVAQGHIATYGCATWNGFRTFAASRNHLSLTELIGVARKVAGGDHHFSVVQLPVNLAMTEAIRAPTQSDNGRNVALLDLAQELGISVVASASLMQAQLTTNLPAPVKAMFPLLKTDAQRAIAFVRSLPVACALVGMKQLDHLDENLVAGAVSIRS